MEDIPFWATEMIKLRNVVFFGSAILDLCSSVPFVSCRDLFFKHLSLKVKIFLHLRIPLSMFVVGTSHSRTT